VTYNQSARYKRVLNIRTAGRTAAGHLRTVQVQVHNVLMQAESMAATALATRREDPIKKTGGGTVVRIVLTSSVWVRVQWAVVPILHVATMALGVVAVVFCVPNSRPESTTATISNVVSISGSGGACACYGSNGSGGDLRKNFVPRLTSSGGACACYGSNGSGWDLRRNFVP